MNPSTLDRLRDSVLTTERFLTPTLGRSPDAPDLLLPFDLCRFEMTAGLQVGEKAQAYQLWAPGGNWPAVRTVGQWTDADGIMVVVWDFRLSNSKMATSTGDRGALGWAIKPHDQPEWEIINMEVPGTFVGTLLGNLTQADESVQVAIVSNGGVHLMYGGYDVFGVNHGPNITAYNQPGGGVAGRGAYWFSGATGDRVLCTWNVLAANGWGRYEIVAAEPNNYGWQEIDVATIVDGTIDPVTHQFTDNSTYKTIQLPPWTTITDP